MDFVTTDSITHHVPLSAVRRWKLLTDISEQYEYCKVDVPFSSNDIEVLLSCTNGQLVTMTEGCQVLSFFNSDGAEYWRETVDIDEHYHDRRSAYIALGVHLRSTGRFRHVHDWNGFDRDVDPTLRESALNLDMVSLVTGIYFSIYFHGSLHHWEAVSLFLPGGYAEYFDNSARTLRRQVAKRMHEGEFSPRTLRHSRTEHSLHLEVLYTSQLGRLRSRMADAFSHTFHPDYLYTHAPSMVFTTGNGSLVTINEPLFSISYDYGVASVNMPERRLKECVIHALKAASPRPNLVSLGLGRLIGDNTPLMDDVTRIYSEAMGYTCKDAVAVVLNDICNSSEPLTLIEMRFGTECMNLVKRLTMPSYNTRSSGKESADKN